MDFFNIEVRSKRLKEVRQFRELVRDRKLRRVDALGAFVTGIYAICDSDFGMAIRDLPRGAGDGFQEEIAAMLPPAANILAAVIEALLPYGWASLLADLVDSSVPAFEIVDEDHRDLTTGNWIKWGGTCVWRIHSTLVFEAAADFDNHHQQHLAEHNFACRVRQQFAKEAAEEDVRRGEKAKMFPAPI